MDPILPFVVAGLLLIGKHAAQFREYLAKDHEVRMYTYMYNYEPYS